MMIRFDLMIEIKGDMKIKKELIIYALFVINVIRLKILGIFWGDLATLAAQL